MEEQLPNRIRDLRDAKHLSLRDLAERSGVAHSKLHRLEIGQTPLTLDRDARKIAEALDVRFSGLLNDDDVELRVDETSSALISAVQEIPVDHRHDAVKAAAAIVRIARTIAAQSTGALKGDHEEIGQLAESWNEFRPEQRREALQLWRLARLGTR
jgi:transcriptional regulator with XRE-family HTH domain